MVKELIPSFLFLVGQISLILLGICIVIGTSTFLFELSLAVAETFDISVFFAAIIVFGSSVILALLHSLGKEQLTMGMTAEEQEFEDKRLYAELEREVKGYRS